MNSQGEVSAFHVLLQHLQKEATGPNTILNCPGDTRRQQLTEIAFGSWKVLNKLDAILHRYNSLSEKEKSVKKPWQAIPFGNGPMAEVGQLREKLVYYSSALGLFLNIATVSSVGRVENQVTEAGDDLRDIKVAVNGIAAQLMYLSSSEEGSVLTDNAEDDSQVWREFRRELIKEGFPSSVTKTHKETIKAYVKELGSRGLLDDIDSAAGEDGADPSHMMGNSHDGELISLLSSSQSPPAAAAVAPQRLGTANGEKMTRPSGRERTLAAPGNRRGQRPAPPTAENRTDKAVATANSEPDEQEWHGKLTEMERRLRDEREARLRELHRWRGGEVGRVREA